jgi:hypothetical protein
VVPAPYVIIGYFVPDNVPDATAILADINTELGAMAALAPLSVPGVFAMRATVANMQKRLDDITNLMVNVNGAHGGVVRWFAQLCEDPWFATEP